MKRYGLIWLMAWLCCLGLWAQGDSVLTLRGKVVDGKSRRPMASVSVTAGSVGTVTNDDGEFSLKLRAGGGNAELTFSCLGFKSRRMGVEECRELEAQKRPVRLQPTSVMLSEIFVSNTDAREVVQAAIDRIGDNYPREANLLRGFYRETVQKRQRFISIAEGVVDVYKSPYHKGFGRDGVAILKGRRLLSQRRGDTLSVKLQGGPVLPIILDLVKERDLLLNHKELDNYSFAFRVPEKTDDEVQYVVEVKPRLVVDYPLFKGLLYIDRETLAFKRVELEVDMSDTGKVTDMILRKKPLGLRFAPKELSVMIDYKTDGGVTRINYIKNVIRFRCDWRRRLFKSNFTVTSEMVVTDRQEGERIRPIRTRDTFHRSDKFYDKVMFFRDPAFWGDENIIEPTEDLLKGIEKIKKLTFQE